MTTPTYTGGMTSWGSIAAWQAAAEKANAVPEVADCGHLVDETGQVVLTGETPNAAGSPVHALVPNLVIEHVQSPVQAKGLPLDLQTSPLGRPSGRK